jgi:hypothetical protein
MIIIIIVIIVIIIIIVIIVTPITGSMGAAQQTSRHEYHASQHQGNHHPLSSHFPPLQMKQPLPLHLLPQQPLPHHRLRIPPDNDLGYFAPSSPPGLQEKHQQHQGAYHCSAGIIKLQTKNPFYSFPAGQSSC